MQSPSNELLKCGLENAFTTPCSTAGVEGAPNCCFFVGDPVSLPFPEQSCPKGSLITQSAPLLILLHTSTLTPISIPTKTVDQVHQYCAQEATFLLLPTAPLVSLPLPCYSMPLPLPACLILSILSQSMVLALVCPFLSQTHSSAFHTTKHLLALGTFPSN